MQRGKKNKISGQITEDAEVAQKALEIRTEMTSIFEDLKHDPHNHELLARFHNKCEEFNNLLKEINRQYEEKHKDLGLFKTRN